MTIKPKEIDQLIERFGLQKSSKSEKTGATWKIPSHRRDLQRDVDLIEEVVRAYGVQKIDGTDRSRFHSGRAPPIFPTISNPLCGSAWLAADSTKLGPQN